MRPLRLTVSLMFCTGSVLVFLMGLHGMVVFPSALFRGASEGIGLSSMSPGDVAALSLLYPLMSLVGLGNAALLGWSGVRGVPAADDARLWRGRQGAGLAGLLTTGLSALAAALVAPPRSGTFTGLPLSVEVVASLYLLYILVLALSVTGVLLLDRRPPRERRAAAPAVRTGPAPSAVWRRVQRGPLAPPRKM